MELEGEREATRADPLGRLPTRWQAAVVEPGFPRGKPLDRVLRQALRHEAARHELDGPRPRDALMLRITLFAAAEEPIKVVSITVDPVRDTPQRLRSYAETFIERRKIDPQRWLFVTHAQGSEQAIGAICQGSFRVAFARAAHSEKLVLVDQQGIVRGYFSPADALDVKRLKRKIQELRQQPPQGDVDKKKASEKEA